MSDICIFCGADVSDLSVHVCSSCADKNQAKLLSDKLQKYRYKLSRAEQHRLIYLKKLGELYWYQAIQRKYLEKIIEIYTDMVEEYTNIIYILEHEVRYRGYISMGGNADPNQMTFDMNEN